MRSSFDATSQHHEEKAFALVFDSAEPDDTEIQSFRVGSRQGAMRRCHACLVVWVPCSHGRVYPMLSSACSEGNGAYSQQAAGTCSNQQHVLVVVGETQDATSMMGTDSPPSIRQVP